MKMIIENYSIAIQKDKRNFYIFLEKIILLEV